jgi:hypothetical protein
MKKILSVFLVITTLTACVHVGDDNLGGEVKTGECADFKGEELSQRQSTEGIYEGECADFKGEELSDKHTISVIDIVGSLMMVCSLWVICNDGRVIRNLKKDVAASHAAQQRLSDAVNTMYTGDQLIDEVTQGVNAVIPIIRANAIADYIRDHPAPDPAPVPALPPPDDGSAEIHGEYLSPFQMQDYIYRLEHDIQARDGDLAVANYEIQQLIQRIAGLSDRIASLSAKCDAQTREIRMLCRLFN